MKAGSPQALAAAILFGWVALGPPALPAEEPPAPAPPLGVDHWVQPKDGGAKTWQELRGKVVVLEFWATWCAPCVAVIPHLNELAKKFDNRGVQFISITDEDASTIEDFLREKPIAGWVGLDTDRSMFNGYGVDGVPHTVLIGPDGALLAATNPEAITEPILEEILAGKVAEARAKLPKPLAPTDWLAGLRSADSAPPLYEVLIRRHQDSGLMGIKWSQSQYVARGFTVKDAIQNAYEVSLARTVTPEALGRDAYDILISISRADSESLRRVLQQALETTFGLRVRRETRETDVFVLLAPEGRTPALREAAADSRRFFLSNKGKIQIRGLSLRNLAQSLESSLKRPVLEETGIEGAFDIELTWDPKKAESLFEALRKLGLELREARRPVELLIVELPEPPAQPEAAKPN